MELSEKRVIEAALFISGKPLSLEQLKQLTGIGAVGYVKQMLDELAKEYEEKKSAVEIMEIEGSYIMKLRNEYSGRVKGFAQDSEISRSALRTLAYVSKHDGMMKSELVKRIGAQVYQDVFELVESGFVRQQRSGRSSKLLLTEKFRKYFTHGVDAPKEGGPQQSLPAQDGSGQQ
ncbi:MAG: SMC-Scp complex subunit ScpB [Candidatus Bilamarchaeaceae archaeon]